MTDRNLPRILCVCLGNICRSPAAEGVLRALRPDWHIDSAATGAWHVGDAPYGPMQDAARVRGYDLSGQRARQIVAADFERFDLILAMDASVLRDCARVGQGADLRLFRADDGDVPDPYYTRDFDGCLDIIETHAQGLIHSL